MDRAINIDRALAIKGWMHPDELQWLAEQALQAQTIVEIGSYRGRSTRALADHCAGVVYAVDPWNGPYPTEDGIHPTIRTDVYAVFAANLQDHLASGRVRPIRDAFTAGCVPAAAVDFVFIDGDHRYAQVLADIECALRLLRPGGVLAGHDYGHPGWPGVKRAVDERFGAAIARCHSLWWTHR